MKYSNVAAVAAQPLAALPLYGCGVPFAGCGCGCGFHSSEKMARKDWNTRAPILSAEEMEMLEGME